MREGRSWPGSRGRGGGGTLTLPDDWRGGGGTLTLPDHRQIVVTVGSVKKTVKVAAMLLLCRNKFVTSRQLSPTASSVKPDNMKHETLNIDAAQLGRELATWRVRQGLTQREAANRFGTSRYTIMRIENAKHVGILLAYKVAASLARVIREEGGEL